MSILASTLLRRYAGGGLMGRIAAVGILRLALRWPALAGIVIVSGLVARGLSRRQRATGNRRPPLPPR